MGSIQRIERPKPWLAGYRGPDGRQHSKTFSRKVGAERWLRDLNRGDVEEERESTLAPRQITPSVAQTLAEAAPGAS